MTIRPQFAVPLLVTLAACVQGADEQAAAQATVSARTEVVTAQPFTETLGAIGSVTARSGHLAVLSAPAPTRISRVLVSAGEHVSSGQPLVELEQAMFKTATQSATASLAAAERAYERADRLSKEGIVPRKDVEAALTDLARARQETEMARRAEQLSVLRAPFSGIVTRLSASLGASVDANQPLVEIADPSALDILLSITPTDAARVRLGAKVSLSAGQDAAGEKLGIGTVVDVSGTVDSTTRSVAVRVQAPTARRTLRIGETIFGEITVAVHANAIAVPLEALVPEGDGFKVFVVDAQGVAHEREVKVGARTKSMAEILEGLTPGERVVTYGAYGMEDSVKVVPVRP